MNQERIKKLLADVDRRAAVVRDRVREITEGLGQAMFVYGPPGHGKTHTILNQLDLDPGPEYWQLHNSHLTAAALSKALYTAPDHIHVIEDCEQLLHDKVAAGILRSACSCPNGRERIVRYKTGFLDRSFTFTGGIIIISNEPLKTTGVFGGVASRLAPVEWHLSQEELAACILDFAQSGHTKDGDSLTRKQCLKVANFLVSEMSPTTLIDFRTYFDHALPAFRLWLSGNSESHWRDSVRAKLKSPISPERQSAQIARERRLAQECQAKGKTKGESRELWMQATKKGKSAYYKRIQEAKALPPNGSNC